MKRQPASQPASQPFAYRWEKGLYRCRWGPTDVAGGEGVEHAEGDDKVGEVEARPAAQPVEGGHLAAVEGGVELAEEAQDHACRQLGGLGGGSSSQKRAATTQAQLPATAGTADGHDQPGISQPTCHPPQRGHHPGTAGARD